MRISFWRRIKSVDWLLFAPMLFLMIVSLTVLYGISINPVSPDPLIFQKQMVFVAIGIVAFFIFSNINYRVWTTYSKVVYLIGALSLIYVLFFGVTIRGTTGWISLGIGTFQPVEFAKIALIIFLAKYFSDHGRLFFLWRHSLISGFVSLLFVALVINQPDLGSAIVIFGTWFLMLLVVGIPRKHVVTFVSLFLLTAIVSWSFFLVPYQKDRILTFLNPQADIQGVGYNVRQSIIAVGSGQLVGRGFGLGSQSQLKFLPEAETDFIFAVIAEEFGFIGVMLVFVGILLILYRLLNIANSTADNYAAFFALGLASLLAIQSFINIGMNMGIAPVTGIPLPFISSGGSSLLAFCIACGIVSSIVSDQRTLQIDKA